MIINMNFFSCSDGPDLEGTLELVSNKPKTPIETTIKLKYKRPKTGQWASPLDPYDIEITFINLMSSRFSEIDIGGEWVKGIDNHFLLNNKICLTHLSEVCFKI